MDSTLSTLGLIIFSITFSIYSVIAESQAPSTSVSPRPPPRSSPSPPPLPRPPHPWSSLKPPPLPPPPLPPLKSPPPTRQPPFTLLPFRRPTSPPLTPPPHQYRPPPSHSQSPHNLSHADPGPKVANSAGNPNRSHHRPPLRRTSQRMNGGKKIGLLFAGIAGLMQIGVIGFLVFKRRQLLRTKDAFEVSA
ncbi:leucine-rich repeat extensin-like protein 3 [Prosopis cineraria]|uniref:leucine-rich repeat extensin-like protein 3 n=1 Tax=Prosopis cineraria TaxID=364024 RepID=UPI002410764A|nr:leucine-rich repeat extensin-like protein 3 [Prosopis cineraria]